MSARPIGHGLITRARTLLVLIVLVAALGAAAAVAAAPAGAATSEDYFFISSLGPTYGTAGAYSFSGSSPDGICVDANGNVYVTLPSGFAKFTATGSLLCRYISEPGWYTPSVGGYGIDVDSGGRVYYADSNAHRIVKLNPYGGGLNGTIYNMANMYGKGDGLGGAGSANGEFDFPRDVAVDGNYLYVADKNNDRIQKFQINSGDNTITWIASWGKNGGDGSAGSGNGEFSNPVAVSADHEGHVFVADSGNYRVQVLSTAGAFVTAFGVNAPASSPFFFNDLNGIDVDSSGNVFAVDSALAGGLTPASRVSKFRPSGATYERVSYFGGWGIGDSQFKFPWNLAVAPNGYLYVTDTQNQKIKKFARDATPPNVHPAGFPTGWTKTIGEPEFIASDPTVAGQYTSNGVSIWYSKHGGASTQYHEPFSSGGFVEGDNSLTYFARDAVGNESAPATLHVLHDKTAPVTTPSGVPNGWSNASVSVALVPGDDGRSAVVSTQYRVQGAATWTTYSGPFTVSAEGVSDYEYRSTDAAGNVEFTKTLTVSIDKTAPVTAITDVPAGWSRTAVTATFSPGDTPSGVASTEYSTNGGANWAPGLSAAITGQGVTALLVRSTDVAGNVEDPKTVTVRIDGTAPVPKALANKSVKRNATVKLQYKITDVPDAEAKVAIKIYKGKAFKKKLTVGTKAANVNLTYSYKCKLPKGKYSWKVFATDLAGNVQAKPGVRTLTVK
jgi:sugar lactone lactonase YvrE